MNKWYLFGMLCLLVVGFASASSVSDSTLRVKDSGSHLVFDIVAFGGSGSMWLETFCSHNGTNYSVYKELVSLSKDKVSLRTTVNEDSGACDWKDKDQAWFTLGDYTSQVVDITQSRGRRVVVPVLTPNEIEFNECKLNALNWFNAHNESRFSKRTYDLMLDVCQFKFDKAQCELNPIMDYRLGHHGFECVEKHIKHNKE